MADDEVVEPQAGELTTANYGFTKPNVGNSDDAWGGMFNADLDSIDSTLHSIQTSVPAASSTTPVMDGTAAVGTGTTFARADHVHPSDTTKYNTSNPSGYQTAAQVTAAVPIASSTTPIVDGTATVGIGTTWARADHAHPSDTTRLPAAGVTDGSNAPSGQIGEVISSNVTTGVSVSGVINLTSIALTAGDWDVQGEVWITFGNSGGTSPQAAMGLTSAVFPAAPSLTAARNTLQGVSFAASAQAILPLKPFRLSVSSTTTVYLMAAATSTPNGTATGNIWARRAR